MKEIDKIVNILDDEEDDKEMEETDEDRAKRLEGKTVTVFSALGKWG